VPDALPEDNTSSLNADVDASDASDALPEGQTSSLPPAADASDTPVMAMPSSRNSSFSRDGAPGGDATINAVG